MSIDLFVIALQILQIFKYIAIGGAEDPLQEEYGTLKHASIIYRHGERSPLGFYPLDPYKNYTWLDGYGQLQNKGKRRMFDVGKWFRIRYQNFINHTYTRHEIRVESSSKHRCIMSALCFLYGFYPAMGEMVWMPNETWQPIPVFAIPRHDDNKILRSKECELRDVLEEKEVNDPKYANTYDEYETVIKTIIKETGINVAGCTRRQIFMFFHQLSDTLKIYRENNLPLPQWANDTVEPLNAILKKTIHDFKFDLQRTRLNCGPLFGSIIGNMRRKLTDDQYRRKLHVYSAHDSTIWNVMAGLKVYDGVLPAYGSSLIFELREKNSINYVTISYRNDTNAPDDARLLDVPGCRGLNCTFQQFDELMKPLIPNDWKKECELPDYDDGIVFETLILSAFVHLVYKRNRLSESGVRLGQNIVFGGV